jgi:hypothetical protein
MTKRLTPGVDRHLTRAEYEAEARRYRQYRESKGDYRSDAEFNLDRALGETQTCLERFVDKKLNELRNELEGTIKAEAERTRQGIKMAVFIIIVVSLVVRLWDILDKNLW